MASLYLFRFSKLLGIEFIKIRNFFFCNSHLIQIIGWINGKGGNLCLCWNPVFLLVCLKILLLLCFTCLDCSLKILRIEDDKTNSNFLFLIGIIM